MQHPEFTCPMEATLSLIGGKYKTLLLWHLKDGPRRYMALQRLLPRVTPKMLTQQLRALEEAGMIRREVIPVRPPKTVYSLTPFGESLVPVLDAMCRWGRDHLDGQGVPRPCGKV